MIERSIPAPSVRSRSFACPHCGAHATHYWFSLAVKGVGTKNQLPFIYTAEQVEELRAAKVENEKEAKELKLLLKDATRGLSGMPFIGSRTHFVGESPNLQNTFISHCHTCGEIAIWLRESLLYPSAMEGPAPNPDLSSDVRRDFEEARAILDASPRGAAALLRLALEKIVTELKAEGRDINQKIAFLVKQGLPVEVQQALDAVRVIGNEAVHPGTMDLRDDRETAAGLFELVNFIAEDRISRPKRVAGFYAMVSPQKREAIEKRDAPKT